MIQLLASSLDRAKHRRRKASAKCRLRLNLQRFLSRFVVVDTATEHALLGAKELCAKLRPGEIGLFDMAYVDFRHLWSSRGRRTVWIDVDGRNELRSSSSTTSSGVPTASATSAVAEQSRSFSSGLSRPINCPIFLPAAPTRSSGPMWSALLFHLLLRFLD